VHIERVFEIVKVILLQESYC